MAKCAIFNLPRELHETIIQNLDLIDLLRLRGVCQSFRQLIPPLDIQQLLEIESSNFGLVKNIYTCSDCLRLLPRTKFADNMVKKKKSKEGADRNKRFCIDCGLNPPSNTARYTRGSYIVVLGEYHVICYSCGRFERAAGERGVYSDECKPCQIESGLQERRDLERRAMDKEARELVGRALQWLG